MSASDAHIEVGRGPDTILLPDLFFSWAAVPAKINPNLDLVEGEAVGRFNRFDPCLCVWDDSASTNPHHRKKLHQHNCYIEI